MNRFQRVTQILDDAFGGHGAEVGEPYDAFWRGRSRDEFVGLQLLGLPLVSLFEGDGSNLVKALRGEAPFGSDIGVPGATIPRLPPNGPPVPPEQIAFIAQWIDDGCLEDEEPIGALDLRLNGVSSGRGFVIVSDTAEPLSSILTLQTTDGREDDVTIRPGPNSIAPLTISPSTVLVSSKVVEVQVSASGASEAQNDTVVEVVRGSDVLVRLYLTAIQAPAIRFAGRFQCRLPTDPDPFDEPWGMNSSFGMYAVQGPDPANPCEPPLDRIIRFHDGVALRPFCARIGVVITRIEAQIGGKRLRFDTGDGLIGLPVRLGPNCKFEGRNEAFATSGYEPISDFRLEIGDVFAGASVPAAPRRPVVHPDDEPPRPPPPTTAPYADGIRELDKLEPPL